MVVPLLAQTGVEVIENARIEARAAQPSLEAAFRGIVQAQSEAAWVGYSVPILAGRSQDCRGSKVFLEGPTQMVMLFRVAERKVEKVRAVTVDCTVDAGGLRVFWFGGVKPAESAALLTGMLGDSADKGQLVAALAWSGEVAALIEVAKNHRDAAVRKWAMSWLGKSKDPKAVKFFEEVLGR